MKHHQMKPGLLEWLGKLQDAYTQYLEPLLHDSSPSHKLMKEHELQGCTGQSASVINAGLIPSRQQSMTPEIDGIDSFDSFILRVVHSRFSFILHITMLHLLPCQTNTTNSP
eukprot:scpid75480/ scgid0558/ 